MYYPSRCRNPLTCTGHQTTPSQGRWYMAGNENLRKLGWNYSHGTMFAPRQYIHEKEATCMERPEMYSPSRWRNPTYLCGPSNHTLSEGRQYRARMETCINYGGHTAMVPCVHQGNIYRKRKLQVWRAKICIHLVGAENPTYLCGPPNHPVWSETV